VGGTGSRGGSRAARSWVDVPRGSAFGLDHLPYGVFARAGEDPRCCVRIGDVLVDLSRISIPHGGDFTQPALNTFMSRGPDAWAAVRSRLTELLSDAAAQDSVAAHLIPVDGVTMLLPWEVADYVDFYSFEQHATNVGRIFRPGSEALPTNWKHLPIGYHGRAGTVVVSGTPVVRPSGQRRPAGADAPDFGPTRRLDIEAEVGFVVGVPSSRGTPVSGGALAEHVFGVVLLNDWSARDIQAWEYVPLGPFLGKSFATSVSAWVTPLVAVSSARVPPPAQDPEPLPYLRDPDPWSLDLQLEVEVNGTVVSRPPFRAMYWTPGQQLAHLTANGASLRTGDLFASGTVSGHRQDELGCLLELTWGGTRPLELPDGRQLGFLDDGDAVVLRASASTESGRLALGEVAGRVLPAPVDTPRAAS
jgi:fumarylacetoacetase